MKQIFEHVGLADTHIDLMRNIVSLRISQDLFDDLSDKPAERDAAVALELATKPRLFASPQPVIQRPFEEAAWNEAVRYPFTHWMRSRYSDGSFGVWYGADSVETSVYETVHHWRTGLLADAGFNRPDIRLERKVYRVRCDAALVDLRPAVAHEAALLAPDDYTLTHQIGTKLQREGHPGLVTRSARCDGEVYAILNPKVLSLPRQACLLTYVTTADGSVRVEREPDSSWMWIP